MLVKIRDIDETYSMYSIDNHPIIINNTDNYVNISKLSTSLGYENSYLFILKSLSFDYDKKSYFVNEPTNAAGIYININDVISALIFMSPPLAETITNLLTHQFKPTIYNDRKLMSLKRNLTKLLEKKPYASNREILLIYRYAYENPSTYHIRAGKPSSLNPPSHTKCAYRYTSDIIYDAKILVRLLKAKKIIPRSKSSTYRLTRKRIILLKKFTELLDDEIDYIELHPSTPEIITRDNFLYQNV